MRTNQNKGTEIPAVQILSVSEKWSRSVMSNSLGPRGLQPIRLLHPCDSPGKNTRVGCHSFSRGSSRPRNWTPVSRIGGRCFNLWATSIPSLVAHTVKRLPTVWETWVQSLGREGLLEKKMATHSSIPAWKIPWTESLVGYSPWGCKESDTTA